MVIMDKQDYINKANQLCNQSTYRSITKDPTNSIKNKLINILKRVKNQTGLASNTYKSMYPTGCVPPKFYGLPKIHKPGTPLRPIVSSCGSATYGVAKELAKILKPLVGKSPHNITSTQDFVEQVKQIKLEPGECLSSYDVSALFTSVPIDPALNTIKDLLEKDTTLKERTVMEVGDIILLLEFCLKNTYFSFQGQFYEQVEGAAMGSPVSPIVANLYMEYLEQKALSTAPHPTPRFWCRYVDDTFVIHREVNKQGFLQHINSVDPAIWFTVEDNKQDGSIPFLDTIVKPEVDGSLSISVYRKPTHTDQYLQWDSHHHLSAKFSVIQTLSHMASTVCSKSELLQKEKDHLRNVLTKCKYPKWALDKVKERLNRSSRQVADGGTNNAQAANHEVRNKGHIVIPYTQGLCESIKKICGKYGIQTHFKGGRTIKNLLVSPKDKDPMVNQSGAIYWYQCGDLSCDDEYIGEPPGPLVKDTKSTWSPPAIHHHSNQTGHTINQNNFQIIGREGHNLARNIKESIYIRVNNPSLNNNIGKFNLSHIWDRVLLNTKGITLNKQQ